MVDSAFVILDTLKKKKENGGNLNGTKYSTVKQHVLYRNIIIFLLRSTGTKYITVNF
jgi:hypothetical protein